MTARERLNNETEADVERSSEEIRQDIVKGKEDISQKVDQIGERIKESLDWREYVKDSPYWAMGAAAGLGYLAARVLKTRTTPMERIMGTIAGEVQHSLGGKVAGAAGPGLIMVTLLGIATEAAAGWIKNAASTEVAGGGGPRPRTGRGSTVRQRMDAQPVVKINP